MLTLILASTPWMGTPFCQLSKNKAGFNLFFVPDEWPGCWSVLILGLILSEDKSTRMMIATTMIAGVTNSKPSPFGLKLRERLLKTFGRHGDY